MFFCKPRTNLGTFLCYLVPTTYGYGKPQIRVSFFVLNPCLVELKVFYIAFWTIYTLLSSCPQSCGQQSHKSHMVNDKNSCEGVIYCKGYCGSDNRLQTIKNTLFHVIASWVGRRVFGWRRAKRTRKVSVHSNPDSIQSTFIFR